jgi:hypothetical protein
MVVLGSSCRSWKKKAIRSATLNLGFGLNVPSPSLVNACENGDPGKEATWLVRGADTGFGEVVPQDATQLYFRKKFSKKAYTPGGMKRLGGTGKGTSPNG